MIPASYGLRLLVTRNLVIMMTMMTMIIIIMMSVCEPNSLYTRAINYSTFQLWVVVMNLGRGQTYFNHLTYYFTTRSKCYLYWKHSYWIWFAIWDGNHMRPLTLQKVKSFCPLTPAQPPLDMRTWGGNSGWVSAKVRNMCVAVIKGWLLEKMVSSCPRDLGTLRHVLFHILVCVFVPWKISCATSSAAPCAIEPFCWGMKAFLHLQTILTYTFSSNFNCCVCLIVAFVCLWLVLMSDLKLEKLLG